MPTPAETTGLLLAGGASRRFGSDKALASLDGRPLIAHVHAAVAPHVGRVLVATGPTPRAYPVEAAVVLDREGAAGPLAGLAAGLAAARTPWLLAVAADLPFLTPDALAPLLRDAPEAADAVVSVDAAGHRQPVCALWRVAAVAPVVDEQIRAGAWSLHALLDRLAVHVVPLAPGALRNVNTPADLDGRAAPDAA